MYRHSQKNQALRASALRATRVLIEPLEERRLLTAITLQAFSTTDYSDNLAALIANPRPSQGLSIRNAVTLANYYVTQGDSVEIDLRVGATYTFSDSPQAEENDSPPAASTPTVAAGVITLNGNGATVDLHNSNGQQEMIAASGSANLTLYDMTIENGTYMQGGAVSVGGSASLTALDVNFEHNSAAGNQQGAALNGGGYAGADADGGAIVANTNGSININSSTFEENSATGAAGIAGGGYGAQGGAGLGGAVSILRAQGVTVSYSTFTSNTTTGGATANNGDGLGPLPGGSGGSYQDQTYAPSQGGALYVASVGTVVLNNDSFTSNSAVGRAGADDWDDHAGENGGLAEGGAIYLLNSSTTISSTTIANSIAQGGQGGAAYDGADQGGKGGFAQGGGLFVSSSQLATSDLTLTGNKAIGGATGWTESGVLFDNGHPQSSPVVYSSAALDYGQAQGGGIFITGAASFNISGGALQNNAAVGFTGENTFYQNNGEDGGSASGGALFISLTGGNSGSINSVNIAQNAADGGTGGSSGGNRHDLSGKGGDARGGAIDLQGGGLTINNGDLLGNSATPGPDGAGSYGPVAAAPDPNNQFTPTLDPTREGLAQGGALYLSAGSLTVTGTQVQSNLADAAAAAAYAFDSNSIGRTGGSAQGGAFYFNNATSSISFSGALLLANIASGGSGGFAVAGPLDGIQPTGGDGGDAAGGAIYLATGSLSITGSELAQNQVYSGQGGAATSGIAGSNGTAYGGGIYANGSVTLTSSLLAYDTAWGGPEASLAGVSGGGDGPWGGGSGGNGGYAFGGGLYLQNGSLNANFAIWELNQAFGGNGGAGYDGTDVGDSGGTPGGGGGSGGSAYGGGVYAGVAASMTLTNSVLKQNLVLGGLGGRGGNGNGNADNPADNGGNGGNGGIGGNAFGGAIAAADADPTYDLPDLSADVISNSRLLDNQAGGGDGGAGGNSGFGGNGDTDGGSTGGRYHGGSGGVSGVGGAGGEAIGGAIWDNGAAFTADQNAIDYNGVTGGWGGDGGYGGAGGDGEDNSVSILGVSTHYDSYGGFGGNGGNGGNGGDALGGGVAVIGGAFVSNSTSLLYNTAGAGFGGDGGEGGEAGQGVQGDGGGIGGTGGTGGDGGNAFGGAVYDAVGYFTGESAASGTQAVNTVPGTSNLSNDTVYENQVGSGGYGQAGEGGSQFGGQTTTYSTTRGSSANGADYIADGFSLGGAAGVTPVLDYPVVFGHFSVFLAKTINPKTPSAARIGGSTAAERLAQDIRYEQRTVKTQANALQNAGDDALMEDEEVVADDLVQTDFVASDETLDLNVSLFDLTISDFAQEVASFAQEAFYGVQFAAGNATQQVIMGLNQATNEVQEAASEFTSTLAGVAEDVADELPAVVSSFAEGVGGSIFGIETGIVAAPALAELAYFGVAGIATGVGALVGELDGSGAGSVATQILSDFLQPGQLSNVRYDFGDLFNVSQSNTETDNGSNGQNGSIGTTGNALGGGVYVDRAINGATPSVKLENDIITQNTAGQRSYQLTGYSGSAYGEFPNVVQDYTSSTPVYPKLQGTVNYDLNDGDVAQGSANGIVSLGTNFIGVRGTITWSASDQVGGAGLPLTTDLVPVQYDETDTSTPIAFESDIQLTAGTGTVDANTQGNGYDELGQDRLTGNTIDIGAVETDGAPLLSLSGDQNVLPTTVLITQPGFATISPSPFANTSDPITYNIDEVGDADLFSVLPTISADGTLSYELAAGASGSTPIAVSATQDGRTSIEQFFQINVVQDSTVEVTTTQPPGTVPAGQDEEYDIEVTAAPTTNGIAAGTTVSVELDMPAGFDLDSIAGNGWTFSNYGPDSPVVFASCNVSSAIAVGGSLPAMAVYGSFQSAIYNPYLTAVDNLTGSNQLDSNSNLVFTNLDDAVFTLGQTGSFQISANEAAGLEQDSSTLPAGFVFNSATGTLTGTPGKDSGGTHSFGVSAIGQLGQIFAQTFTVTIDEPISTSTAGSLSFTEGQSGNYSITATGYPIPSGFFSITGTLPAGLSYSSTTSGDTTTLSITGTPVAGSAGQYPIEELIPRSNNPGISAEFVFVTLAVTAPNPAPTLSGISSSIAVYGSNATTIKLNGTGFVSSSVARWNGVALATTYINSKQVSAVIPAADLLAAGTYAITVYSPGPGGGTSRALTFTVARATPIVTLNVNNSTPTAIVVGVDNTTVSDGTLTYTYYDSNGNLLAAKPTAAGSYGVTATFNGDPNYLPATSVRVAFTIGQAKTLTDVTAQLKVVRGGLIYSTRTHTYSQTLTITNSGAAINGPLALLLDGLSSGTTLTNQSGVTTVSRGGVPAGTPYLSLPTTALASGGSVSITLQFTAITPPTYTPQFLLGSGML